MNEQGGRQSFTLVICCPDAVGIVAAVAGFVAGEGGSLIESNHHTDIESAWFFMRNEIDVSKIALDIDGFRERFEPIGRQWNMRWYVRDNRQPQRVVIMASHAAHCIADLLYRWREGELPCEIPCVISNHENLRDMVEWHDIPFHHVPVDKQNKAPAFAAVRSIIEQERADSIVLARYMQIIPPELCDEYANRLINIHHSFLPSFVGANPYQRAFERGVKLIGATCHYVTEDLDEGPMIEQDVIRVSHSCDKNDLVRLGRDVERSVLSRGLLYHLEERVLVYGNRTIVFAP